MELDASISRDRELGIAYRLNVLLRRFTGHRLVRAGVQMTGFRIVSLGIGAAGSVWAARCLGPEKTGISGLVLATCTQLALLATFNQDVALIRRYKDMQDAAKENELISGVFSQRMLAVLILNALAWAVLWARHLPIQYLGPALVGSALLFLTANTPTWLLQARENMPAQYRMVALQACLSAALIAIFFRPGMPTGSDLIVTLAVTGLVAVLTWRIALADRHSLSPGFREARKELPLLWQGRWLFLSGIVMYLYISSEQPLLAYIGSVRELGQYRSAVQISVAIQPFLGMFSTLLYPRYVEWNRQGPEYLWSMQLKICKLLAIPLVVAALLVIAIVPKAQPILFGPRFAAAAVPCVWLILSKLVIVLNSVFTFGLWARRRDKATLLIMSITAFFSVTANFALIPRFGMLAASIVNFTSEIIILFGMFLYTLWLLKRSGIERSI